MLLPLFTAVSALSVSSKEDADPTMNVFCNLLISPTGDYLATPFGTQMQTNTTLDAKSTLIPWFGTKLSDTVNYILYFYTEAVSSDSRSVSLVVSYNNDGALAKIYADFHPAKGLSVIYSNFDNVNKTLQSYVPDSLDCEFKDTFNCATRSVEIANGAIKFTHFKHSVDGESMIYLKTPDGSFEMYHSGDSTEKDADGDSDVFKNYIVTVAELNEPLIPNHHNPVQGDCISTTLDRRV